MTLVNYLQIKHKRQKMKKTSIDIYEDKSKGLTTYVVKKTGAMITEKPTEFPSVNITSDGLLECRYHPYETRQHMKSEPKQYLSTKTGPRKKYSILPTKWGLFSGPCCIVKDSNIITSNPNNGHIEFVKKI